MILLALGSNLGDRVAAFAQAHHALEARGVIVGRMAEPVETPAMLPPDAPASWNQPFLNTVWEVTTPHAPETLLAIVKEVEHVLGRQDRGRWGPREIDIDILAYHDRVIDIPALQIPHPGLAARAFVLQPLAHIAPGWRHPLLDKTAQQLWASYRREHRPKLVGILNVTPDSFSDGGAFLAPAQAQAQLEHLLAAGADMVDLGAESTRPGAAALDATEEWARLAPVLGALPPGARISLDTRHAETAARGLDAGVDIINDQGGLRDPAMRRLLAQAQCPVVVMHALSLPARSQEHSPENVDVVEEIIRWKAEVTAHAEQCGIAPERLIYDPGIGFGKTKHQSLSLLRRADALVASGGQWLYGHSRKSFLTLFTNAPAAERDRLTLAFSQLLARCGVQYLRVHNVAAHAEVLCM